jgi:hypothetical protein
MGLKGNFDPIFYFYRYRFISIEILNPTASDHTIFLSIHFNPVNRGSMKITFPIDLSLDSFCLNVHTP